MGDLAVNTSSSVCAKVRAHSPTTRAPPCRTVVCPRAPETSKTKSAIARPIAVARGFSMQAVRWPMRSGRLHSSKCRPRFRRDKHSYSMRARARPHAVACSRPTNGRSCLRADLHRSWAARVALSSRCRHLQSDSLPFEWWSPTTAAYRTSRTSRSGRRPRVRLHQHSEAALRARSQSMSNRKRHRPQQGNRPNPHRARRRAAVARLDGSSSHSCSCYQEHDASHGTEDLLACDLRGEPGQILAKLGPQAFVLETKFNCGLQITELASAVVTLAFELVGVDVLFGEEVCDPVRQLNFPARAAPGFLELLEHGRRQHVSSDNGKC